MPPRDLRLPSTVPSSDSIEPKQRVERRRILPFGKSKLRVPYRGAATGENESTRRMRPVALNWTQSIPVSGARTSPKVVVHACSRES